jgi:hypothetical protein
LSDVYITSTLKSEWNKKYNPLLCEELEKRQIKCYLPQRDTPQEGEDVKKLNNNKYEFNINAIKNSKFVLAVGLNESINWGLEVGFAFGIKKKVILLKEKNHFVPVMSLGMYEKIIELDTLNDIESYIDLLVDYLK